MGTPRSAGSPKVDLPGREKGVRLDCPDGAEAMRTEEGVNSTVAGVSPSTGFRWGDAPPIACPACRRPRRSPRSGASSVPGRESSFPRRRTRPRDCPVGGTGVSNARLPGGLTSMSTGRSTRPEGRNVFVPAREPIQRLVKPCNRPYRGSASSYHDGRTGVRTDGRGTW